jgi:hypothetical protein
LFILPIFQLKSKKSGKGKKDATNLHHFWKKFATNLLKQHQPRNLKNNSNNPNQNQHHQNETQKRRRRN